MAKNKKPWQIIVKDADQPVDVDAFLERYVDLLLANHADETVLPANSCVSNSPTKPGK